MFKKGERLRLTMLEGGSETEYFDCLVLQYEDGLLKVRMGADDEEVIYNVHSANFVKAKRGP